MIVVIDAGVWISAIRFGGVPLKAVRQALAVDQVAISDIIEREVIEIAVSKMGLHRDWMTHEFAAFTAACLKIRITGDIAGICRDPNDDHVLECAKKSAADLIISGDKDLLSLQRFEATEILSARAYLERGS